MKIVCKAESNEQDPERRKSFQQALDCLGVLFVLEIDDTNNQLISVKMGAIPGVKEDKDNEFYHYMTAEELVEKSETYPTNVTYTGQWKLLDLKFTPFFGDMGLILTEGERNV